GMLSGDTRAVSDELSRLVDARLGQQSEALLALNRRIVNVERERETLEARLRALEHSQEADDQGSEAGDQGLWEQMIPTMEWKRWRLWVTEVLVAVLIGFAIVGLGDYIVRGDDIPLLPDRQPAAPATTRIPTSEAVTPDTTPPANGITGPSRSSSAKTPEPPPASQ
ncbi:MAG TPA: hypothetical protein VFU22_32745, partial [Roseiflexaceae bacterium]|nr:hypothetical protein [Roseiflexaceae bacterium]